ncbi:unnamed protein product [Somion occarium]|uniref:Glycogenin n=1 Tax=Somion occarium TaxID=3059160 RepID=A0ABP1CH23_9APHY
MATPFAFVTLVSSDSYLPGALALVAALKELHPKPPVPPEVDFQTVCLVTPEMVDVSSIRLLRKAFDLVVGVEVIEQRDVKGLQLLGRLDLNSVLTKLHIFRLTQYSKIIFLDADVLPIRPLSHLFNLPYEFAAVPDVGWPDIFNSGVLVLSPGEDKFNELRELLKSRGSWDGGDQGLLNEWRGHNWHRLSFTYNTTPTAAYTYAPAYERFGSKISAIHFIGPNKPWKSLPFRAPGTKSTEKPSLGAQQTYDYSTLLDRWYEVYDRNYRTTTPTAQQAFEIQRYASAWDKGSTFGAEIPTITGVPPVGATMGLDELKRITTEGISSLSLPAPGKPAEGEYRSLPLDGRVDLMQPKYEPGPEPEYVQHGAVDTSPRQAPPMTTEVPLRLETLPTPGPNEVPPAPYHYGHSLPPTEMPTPYYGPSGQQPHPEQFEGGPGSGQPSAIIPPGDQQGQYFPPAESHEQPTISQGPQGHDHPHIQYRPPVEETQHHPVQHHDIRQAPIQLTRGSREGSPTQPRSGRGSPVPPIQQQPQTQYQSPQYYPQQQPRSPSPPRVPWNPAIEPPPRDVPLVSSFPADTYFPNIWDQPPSQQHDATFQSFPLHPSTPHVNKTDAFFHAPPSVIPEQLVREGQYANVLGSPTSPERPGGLTQVPTPDRNKVKTIFPWEEKPRHFPRRVFPAAEAPPRTAKFIEEEKPKPSPPKSATERPHLSIHTPSPATGLPPSLTFANAWDTVPSIQRYASKLVRPHIFQMQQFQPPQPPENGWRKLDKERQRTFQERQDASSMDGDDEDEGEDEGDSELSDDEKQKHRSRVSSPSFVPAQSKSNKQYKMQGVQTITPKMKSKAVQVTILRDDGTRARTESLSSTKTTRSIGTAPAAAKRERHPSSSPVLLPSAVLREARTEYRGEQMSGTPLVDTSLRASMPFPSMETPTGLRSPQTLGSPRTYSPPNIGSPAKSPSPPKSGSPRQSLAKPSGSRRTSTSTPPTSTSPQPILSPPQALRPAPSPRRVSTSTPPLKTESPVTGTAVPRGPQATPPPQRALPKLSSPFSPQLARSISMETAATLSPATSASLATPEGTPVTPSRTGGRVFDPARGVDVFKRGSEEVLARFLRMGSFEEEESQRRQHVQ